GPATAISVTPNVTLPSHVGTPITWTATASGGTATPLQYKFYLYTQGSGWSLLQDYGPNETFTWTPTVAGTYQVQVWVRSAGSTQAYESFTQTMLFVIQP
ncbi:MAG TPA: triple tyrosine motif-containing protein, partial [Chloroflexota bacterium]|nr:triple tyrosine motif-containing protein [Chloroflexota bacterium]